MKTINKYFTPILILFVLFVGWFLASRNSNPLFVPKPESVWNNLLVLYDNGTLMRSIGYSFGRITIAATISGIISIPIALLSLNFKPIEAFVDWFIGVLRYIPPTVFYPLLIMWVGIGESMKLWFLFLVTFVYFLPSVVMCMRETDSNLIDTAMSMGMSRFQIAYKVMLPYTLPSICQTFLMMYGIGWTYVIIVEVINAHYGLGHIINLASNRGNTAQVFAAVLLIIAISVAFDKLGKLLIHKRFAWKFKSEVKESA